MDNHEYNLYFAPIVFRIFQALNPQTNFLSQFLTMNRGIY